MAIGGGSMSVSALRQATRRIRRAGSVRPHTGKAKVDYGFTWVLYGLGVGMVLGVIAFLIMPDDWWPEDD